MRSISSFRVGHLLLAWGLPLSVVCIPRETPLEKMTFSFGSGYQLEIAIKSCNFIGWLEFSLLFYLPLSCSKGLSVKCQMSQMSFGCPACACLFFRTVTSYALRENCHSSSVYNVPLSILVLPLLLSVTFLYLYF